MEEYLRDKAYRFYVTKSLSLIPQNRYLTTSYEDMIQPKKIDRRSGEEIAADVIKQAGLSFG